MPRATRDWSGKPLETFSVNLRAGRIARSMRVALRLFCQRPLRSVRSSESSALPRIYPGCLPDIPPGKPPQVSGTSEYHDCHQYAARRHARDTGQPCGQSLSISAPSLSMKCLKASAAGDNRFSARCTTHH